MQKMRFNPELKRWDPVKGLVGISLIGSKAFLILISLGIVMWQAMMLQKLIWPNQPLLKSK